MVLSGHADDCAACRWHDLTPDDQAVLDEAAFQRHTRADRPRPAPARPNSGGWPMGAGIAVGLVGLGVGNQWVMVLGCLIYVAGMVVQRKSDNRWEQRIATRLAEYETWKAQQARAWLEARSRNQLWPCPTCGSLSCPNLHFVTTENTFRGGGMEYTQTNTDPA